MAVTATIVLTAGLIASVAAAADASPSARATSEIPEKKDELERLRRAWFEKPRLYPAHSVPTGARMRVWRAIQESAASFAAPSGAATGPWINIGPAPQTIYSGLDYSNRISHLAADPGNASHWLVSATGGGLWETLDAGVTWAPRTDGMPSLATGAIAFSRSNPLIAYSGIGEPGFGGLLKSSDGGTTWQLMATSVFSAGDDFLQIRVHATDPAVVYAATWSYFPDATAGIWKSVDGGATWTHQLTGRAMDLAGDPGNMSHQYTILGGGYADAVDGVYRYNGTTWTRITGPWGTLTGNIGSLAIAPSNANVLYVSIQGKAIWKTTNAWAGTPTWTLIPAPPEFIGAFAVDRTSANVLWGGGYAFYKFDGTSWIEMTRIDQANGMHVDQRCVGWAGTRLIVGNDGGVFSTVDGGAHWLDHNSNLSVSQFYSGSLHPTNANVAMGGTQDDGTPRWTGGASWSTTTWGDGMSSMFSTSNPDSTWATSVYYLSILRTRDGGASYEQIDSGIDPENRPFFGKFEKCPANENVVIAGSHALWKSVDFFAADSPSWSLDGPDMLDWISAVAFAPGNSACQIYAYGDNDSNLRRTISGGGGSAGAWADLDPSNAVPPRSITDLAFHPTDPNILYVTLSGYDENTPGRPGHLFKTANALAATPIWVNVSAPNSDVPYDTVVLDPLDPSTVYVGTDIGVWRSFDAGASWSHMGPETGMPGAVVNDLQFNRTTSTLAAFTYGRGALTLGGASGVVPDTSAGGATPLTLLQADGILELSWGASCASGDADYEVYEGSIGDYYSHVAKYCSTGRATTIKFPVPSAQVYYLVVPTTTLREGSYGRHSNGAERPQGSPACVPQRIAPSCP